ncbi:G-protein alpha subunit-domain-containing protein [Crucibulum laeve]|uniref:G-protein alpha subunit-domain-containing protein n=1 Tax=Crucibulum laeve TaxID=68775 RepID=A0A5C3LQR3_9AGAR|nr:G-protein alpha subunit-domain-containing protein [Crucibulum laeve]
MGGCVSTPDRPGIARSDAIDRQIQEHNKRFKRECKILLLGSGESGKSTIVKQMKIIHQGGFSMPELAEYRLIVYKNVLASAQAVILYMRKIGWECEGYDNRVSSHFSDWEGRGLWISMPMRGLFVAATGVLVVKDGVGLLVGTARFV